jgi:hypothetical protein
MYSHLGYTLPNFSNSFGLPVLPCSGSLLVFHALLLRHYGHLAYGLEWNRGRRETKYLYQSSAA